MTTEDDDTASREDRDDIKRIGKWKRLRAQRDLDVLGTGGVGELSYQIEALEGQIIPSVPMSFCGLQSLLEMVYGILAARDIDNQDAAGCGPVTALVAQAARAVEDSAGAIYNRGAAS